MKIIIEVLADSDEGASHYLVIEKRGGATQLSVSYQDINIEDNIVCSIRLSRDERHQLIEALKIMSSI